MAVLVVNQAEVRRLLPMEACMEAMAQALRTMARGEVVQPLRSAMWLADKSGLLGLMPGYLSEPAAFGLKVVSVFPANHGTEFDSHQGAVLLFDATNGSLVAVMDGTEITSVRTAAVSGVATRALARPEARRLAILGAGTQGVTHLEAMLCATLIDRVTIWSRNPEHAEQFAREGKVTHGIDIDVATEARAAVEDADIICTTSAATEPILQGEWIAPGAHINAVGACFKNARELDTAAVVKSKLFVDRIESALNEAGDFLIPKAEGAIGDDHIRAELGDVLTGAADGRTSPDEITLFKSLGIAIEDLAAAQLIYQRATREGVGASLELGGRRRAAD